MQPQKPCGSNQKQGAGSNASGVTGAGSTFVYPVLSAWAADYKTQGGANVNYQSIGSGGGIAQVKAGTVDFGATDQPLASDDLAKSGLAQFPIVIGGIVPVLNVSGLEPGKLRLTGPLLADIFAGKVKTWNDKAIAALNPGVSLPGTNINVVHRSDASGTTFNFTHYLSQVSTTWKGGPGEGKSVNWPTGVGGKGNEGVAAYVKQIPNSIGYVEYAYVVQNHMRFVILAPLPAAALLASAPASAAQLGSYNDPAPGASSLMRSDFSNAEREIRGAKVDASDPARAINLGIALAKNGQRDEAAKLFNSVLAQDDVQMVVADGETLSSHQVAERALQSLQSGVLSR